MVWNTMILSQCVIVRRVVGRPLDEEDRVAAIWHYRVTRTSEGGWGMHAESGPCVFLTALAYVALRLLGVPPDDLMLSPAREWLRSQPCGVLSIPTWGKFWLAMVGLYDYSGVNPVPPELFILPRWLPVHPDRLYCHTRNIFQGMAYLYGSRYRADLGQLGTELRAELYGGPIRDLDFAAHRFVLADSDVILRPGKAMRAAYRVLSAHERFHSRRLRRRALDVCLGRIVDEQHATGHQGLSAVNGLLNCLALFASDPGHPDIDPGLAGVECWRWSDAVEGLRYVGARSQSWDTSFSIEALLAAPRPQDVDSVRGAHSYLRGTQSTAELARVPAGRLPVLGGWCFSDGGHRWPVSDCAAEAVAALTKAERQLGSGLAEMERIPPERVLQAVAFILDRQNPDGGFGTYERRRGPKWLDATNSSEMWTHCMVEGSYVECTGSALAAFACVLPRCDDPRARRRVTQAMARGVSFLRGRQRSDGSFEGSWGVNFTYATWMAVRGLRAAGLTATEPALARAATWMRSVQRSDGGWGEHHSSCLSGSYVEHPDGQPVMTAWAMLGLLEVGGPHDQAVARAAAWLCEHQRADGSWHQEAATGLFFAGGVLHYRLYADYFPAWALGAYLRALEDRLAGERKPHQDGEDGADRPIKARWRGVDHVRESVHTSSPVREAVSAAPAGEQARVVVLDHVRHRFGPGKGLIDLDLHVPAGSITVLVGPNGAGKTTALRVITGALPPQDGTARVFGLDPRSSDGEEVRRRCGVVAAKPALYDRLTGRDNLRYAAELFGLGRNADVEQAAARFGIERVAGPAGRRLLDGHEDAAGPGPGRPPRPRPAPARRAHVRARPGVVPRRARPGPPSWLPAARRSSCRPTCCWRRRAWPTRW